SRSSVCPLSLHDALPISSLGWKIFSTIFLSSRRLFGLPRAAPCFSASLGTPTLRYSGPDTTPFAICSTIVCPAELWRESRLPNRSEEHTSELQSRGHLVC